MDMGTQGSGRKRLPNRERLTAEDDALNQIAREAEARLAAKRAARAEAREIRMKELERQQKEIYQVQKKYYGLDTKWGDIEQWMEDSERYSRRFRRNASASDEDERLSVGSRGSLRVQPELEYGSPYAWTNGYDGDYCGSQSLSRRSGRNSSYSGGDGRVSSLSSSREEKLGLFGSDLGLPSSGLASKPLPTQNGPRPFVLCNAARPAGSYWASMLDESSLYGARRGSTSGSRAPSEYGGHLNSSSRASSRASSARASPVVEERPDKDFAEKGSRNMPSLSAATLASLGGTSSRRGSGDTSISMDTEASIREIKDSLAEVEEKYKKAMVSNAQLDNEKTNFMYQVDTLKDMLLELEEQLAESQRQYEEKNKEFEREKHAHSILQFQFAEVKEALRQREEMLEKHGIILNSEIATNGETSDTVNDVGYQAPTKITKEELNALKAAGEGTLGKAKEVEVKKEIVEKVGQRETLQDSEQEQPKLNTGKDCVDRGVLHPGEKAENQRPVEDSALSPGPLAGAKCEQEVQSQDQENTSILKSPEQIESHEVTNKSDSRDSNSPEPSSCRGGLDSEVSGPTALGIKNQSENSMDSQGKENQEDLGKGSFEPRPDHVLGQTPEIDKVSCTDSRGTGGNHLEDVVQAGDTIVEDQVGTMASAEQSKSMENHIGRSLNDGLGQSSERELAHEAAELEEALTQSSQAGGENTVTEAEDAAVRDEKPLQADVQATPAAPTVQSGHQDTTGPGSTDTKHTSPHAKERNKAKSEQQAEALDSPQKKTKNKKKKNKKKKAAAPMETCKDANEESSCQDPDVGDGEEEERVQATDKKWAAETPELKEDPQSRPSGKQNDAEEDSGPAEGPTDVLDQNSLQCADGDISPVGRKGPQRDASQIGGEEGLVPSQHPGQADEKGIEGHSVDNSDLSGELGGFNSESGEQAREEVGNSKSKEDCTMS
ncbi:leucine-rich repeat flightless-interacting protein 1 isoform X10 [Rattus norvegicus]|uniref:leucine-rich repeat flightless-interacting protein 1 isoform X10 n=1 Tax=Rattus norvegicus TaxID=10116 RepID=UPI0003D0F99C|nr:leucine-rich repeat flightless-interacting protein 1 isoform X15 [Rattus norvegicus]|eukprot:XP_006245514.1 PREDICTED: leucine-rich repeat flightless-interacting protein 1 isoform X13 [Rattus norvegicus]